MKKILLSLLLMSLVGMSSCDKLSFDPNPKFIPYGWEAVYSDDEPLSADAEASKILIKGMRNIVFDEIEKTDWKIYLPSKVNYEGRQSLQLIGGITDSTTVVDAIENTLIEIPTNYESIPVNLSNLTVAYDYMGESLKLPLIDDNGNKVTMKLSVAIKPEFSKNKNGVFMEYGYIVFRLIANYIIVKTKKLQYVILYSETTSDY
ncbi:MAG: hypothetical protein IJ099_01335 [Alphaproteobacteria bacterium]|nr:hypothetical protein [Alphaproteobacteria bacterium]